MSSKENTTSTHSTTNGNDEDIESSFEPSILFDSKGYNAEAIRREFQAYQSVLPPPDKLLQEHHSVHRLRTTIEESGVDLPRFLRTKDESGNIVPHQALCCLLLDKEDQAKQQLVRMKRQKLRNPILYVWKRYIYPMLVKIVTFGCLHPQINNPACFIRDQFDRVRHAIPSHDVVDPHLLRSKIRSRGLPVPNYFLDPEDHKQFPPHIALLVILYDGERYPNSKSNQFFWSNSLYRFAFSVFAVVALLLRIVLEVIGAAGAIWGGAEVVTLRNAENAELWRWISVGVGVVSWLRFLTLNLPQKEDEGDLIGPAGPWSLRLPGRLRAVCNHPFHYFVRALPPYSPTKKHD